MARKNAGSKAKASESVRGDRAAFVGYVNITLTAENAEDFKGWFAESDVAADAYLDALELGYQFTLKLDKESDTFMCSLSNWNPESQDAGIIYTGRSGSVEGALWKSVYVWDRVLNRNLSNGYVKKAHQDAF